MPETTRSVMLVEDSPEDFEATRRALARAGLTYRLHHCPTGDEALDYLLHGSDASRPLPSLILLDLNLPGTDGRQVLSEIKSDERLRQIPVVVLTTSDDDRDVSRCYLAGANSYIQKPVDLAGFRRAMTTLRNYWLDVVLLPQPG